MSVWQNHQKLVHIQDDWRHLTERAHMTILTSLYGYLITRNENKKKSKQYTTTIAIWQFSNCVHYVLEYFIILVTIKKEIDIDI